MGSRQSNQKTTKQNRRTTLQNQIILCDVGYTVFVIRIHPAEKRPLATAITMSFLSYRTNSRLHPLHGVVFISEEKLFLTKSRFEVIKPGGLGIVFGKENALYPVGIAALDKAQDKDFLAIQLNDALDFHLTGTGTHGRTAYRACQS